MFTTIKVHASGSVKSIQKSNEGEEDVRCDAVQDMPLILTVKT